MRQAEHKRYVKVRADYLLDGSIRPLMFKEEDGPTILIDNIVDVRQAPALKAGGQGTRYICRIGPTHIALFFDRERWFIELM